LSEDQLAYAWNFAGRPQERLQPAFVHQDGVPLVAQALAHFVCVVETTYPGGDHTLFLGRVERLWYRDGSPLTFYHGRFFGVIPLPAGLWSPGAEATAPPEDTAELSLLDPWW
ncbi:MAG: flavin reductase family protein, partial [bacterium]